MQVDLIVRNARIHTGDGLEQTDALAVLHGRVVALGGDVRGLRARETVDARGAVVLPGFADAHAHSVWFGMTLIEADLSAVASIEEIYRIVEDRARMAGPDDWIVASGYNPALLRWRHPDRDALDRASGGRPVWIKHASGHSCQVNGAALALTEVEGQLGAELDGGVIVVDDSGRPTGVLEERAMSLVRDVLLPYPLATIEQALDLATSAYAREGLTAVTDCGVAAGWIGNAPGEVAAYQDALEHGVLRTRMQVMPVIDALTELAGHQDEPARRGLGTGVRSGWGDDRLSFGPAKVFTDGSILGRTARLSDDYEGCPGNHGYLQEDHDVMREKMIAAYAGGWSLAVHAVGDAALDFALDTVEEAVRKYGPRRIPNRVEHGIVVRPDQLDRLADLGVTCVVQPGFVRTFGEGMRRALGDDRVRWSVRARSLIDADVPFGISSDRPVAPGAPLAAIQSYVERLTEEGRPYNPAERITVDEAVRAASLGTAQVTGHSGDRGRLVPGQLADMVFLDAHPAEVPVSDIHAIPVRATAVGGLFTHRSADL